MTAVVGAQNDSKTDEYSNFQQLNGPNSFQISKVKGETMYGLILENKNKRRFLIRL